MERLIQEDYTDDPWKMMVSCILLNQTSNTQVRPILNSLFNFIPDPISCISVSEEDIAALIKTTGFQNTKAKRIKKMASVWITGFSKPSELPGIGKYGNDSWDIFINKEIPENVTDKKLLLYIKSINENI